MEGASVDAIYRAEYQTIFRRCQTTTRNPEDAEDLTSQIFLVLCKMRRPSVKLLDRIATHRLLNWSRDDARRSNVFDDSAWAKGQYDELAYGIEMDGNPIPDSGGQSGKREPARPNPSEVT